MTEKEEEKKIARVWRIVASDRFRRSNARIKRGAKSLIDSARSWLPRYEKSLSHPSSSRVKFCSVNHNVTSIHPRDRDWQSAYTRVHARLMNLPCPTLHVSGRNACTRARSARAVAVAGIRSLPGLGHFMRDNSLYLMLLVFLETIMEIRKEGFFWEIFLVFGEKEARIKSFRSFEVFLFGFLIFFFFWFTTTGFVFLGKQTTVYSYKIFKINWYGIENTKKDRWKDSFVTIILCTIICNLVID